MVVSSEYECHSQPASQPSVFCRFEVSCWRGVRETGRREGGYNSL